MLRRVVEPGAGRGGVDQERASAARLWRQERLLGFPESTVEAKLLVLAPQPLQDGRELVGHHVAVVVLDRLEAEHAVFARLVAGDDVDPPSATRDVVHRRAELGDMERMPSIEDVHRVDQHDRLGQRRQGRVGDDRIDLVLAEAHLAAIAAFPEPLRQTEH